MWNRLKAWWNNPYKGWLKEKNWYRKKIKGVCYTLIYVPEDLHWIVLGKGYTVYRDSFDRSVETAYEIADLGDDNVRSSEPEVRHSNVIVF
jgi:hypothetical protein